MAWSDDDRRSRRHRQGVPDQRTESERDRDRILYSSAFQRLGGITQIVRAGEADVFHTRQQHTIKVAQIGRRLAQALAVRQPTEAIDQGLDPDVVEAACLAHDLGHPPFGHIGESALNELVRNHGDKDGFEGNAQSFRILTKLSVRFGDCDGMDLTRATLAASLKYPWMRSAKGKKSKKWSVYKTEEQDFNWTRQFHKDEFKTLEAEVMDWADDVAYSVHDLEDFHRCNVIPWRSMFEDPRNLLEGAVRARNVVGTVDENPIRKRLEKAIERLTEHIWGSYKFLLTERYEGTRDQREQLRRMTSQMIGNYVESIEIPSSVSKMPRINIDEDHEDEISILKQITRDYIIGQPSLLAQQRGQERVIVDLYDDLMGYLKKNHEEDIPPFLPIRLRYLRALSSTSDPRFVADCIASLSEREALALHGRLMGVSSGSVLDPIVR